MPRNAGREERVHPQAPAHQEGKQGRVHDVGTATHVGTAARYALGSGVAPLGISAGVD